ncbi:MAG: hypothetical protein LBG09_01200 [Puniceicoccales bacterium]|jgi:hypothetical protein|nr:hypothetical protein [Puniceicoccales bacterium]
MGVRGLGGYFPAEDWNWRPLLVRGLLIVIFSGTTGGDSVLSGLQRG